MKSPFELSGKLAIGVDAVENCEVFSRETGC